MNEIDDLPATARYIGCTPAALRNRRYRGDAPPAIKLGAGPRGAVRFRKADVDRWLAERSEATAMWSCPRS